ncbi:MAG: hypothetical protein C4527_12075 [Candidatus Omnitrophota bacterium]|nr:MAG: hypothetical protein C4527_12075 [Candidatus Omnitrophota bacterium]
MKKDFLDLLKSAAIEANKLDVDEPELPVPDESWFPKKENPQSNRNKENPLIAEKESEIVEDL